VVGEGVGAEGGLFFWGGVVCRHQDPSIPRQTDNVSALDFLSVSAATDDKGFHPVARSCVERRFRDAGATFEERAG
ncbi:MAG: hypothetical protein ACR2HI_06600, partial [Gaiella sp.]